MVKQVGILLAIIAFSVTAAAGIQSLTGGGGCCGSCCQQTEKEYVEVSSFFAVLAITVFLWLNIAVIARCIFGK